MRDSVDSPAEARERLPDWSAVPDEASGRRPIFGVTLRAGIGVAVSVLLYLAGRHVPAIVLLAVLGLATAASFGVPAVAHVLDRATRAVQRGAARVLTFMVLGVLELVVVTPAALILRLVRVDPMKQPGAGIDGSFWLLTDRHPTRRLYRREFAYERVRAGGRDQPSSPRRTRIVLAAAALLLVVDLAIGVLLHTQDPPAIVNPAQTLSLLPSATVPAARGEPWAKELGLELGHVYYGQRYDPYLGWRMPNYAGRYVHVRGGLRRSYQGPGSRSPRALQVFFFGGSALFGVFQRDEETIPSDFARLAAASGIPVKVWNFGAIGYVNWQEVLQFEQLLSSGHTPDLAVFYDGANELLTQFRIGPHTSPSNPEAQALAQLLPYAGVTQPAEQQSTESPFTKLYHAYGNVSAINYVLRRLEGAAASPQLTLPPFAGSQSRNAVNAGRDAALIYNRGVALVRRVAAGYGVRSSFFWQPIIYSKRKFANELPAADLLGTEPPAWTRAYRIARAGLRPPAIDVAGALNGLTTPIMFDFVHTNELGARVMARSIFTRLAPSLRQHYGSKHG